VKLAEPTTACAGFACPLTGLDRVCCAPSTPPRVEPVEFRRMPAFAFPATFAEPEIAADAEAFVEALAAAAHEPLWWLFKACTSTMWVLPLVEQSAALCGWLLPGPYNWVDAPAPLCMAIWPAVLPFP
jgi:hypothetical protein